eukprot:scaffold81478_cov59-Cyclotella_meneghiniana.AAC.1
MADDLAPSQKEAITTLLNALTCRSCHRPPPAPSGTSSNECYTGPLLASSIPRPIVSWLSRRNHNVSESIESSIRWWGNDGNVPMDYLNSFFETIIPDGNGRIIQSLKQSESDLHPSQLMHQTEEVPGTCVSFLDKTLSNAASSDQLLQSSQQDGEEHSQTYLTEKVPGTCVSFLDRRSYNDVASKRLIKPLQRNEVDMSQSHQTEEVPGTHVSFQDRRSSNDSVSKRSTQPSQQNQVDMSQSHQTEEVPGTYVSFLDRRSSNDVVSKRSVQPSQQNQVDMSQSHQTEEVPGTYVSFRDRRNEVDTSKSHQTEEVSGTYVSFLDRRSSNDVVSKRSTQPSQINEVDMSQSHQTEEVPGTYVSFLDRRLSNDVVSERLIQPSQQNEVDMSQSYQTEEVPRTYVSFLDRGSSNDVVSKRSIQPSQQNEVGMSQSHQTEEVPGTYVSFLDRRSSKECGKSRTQKTEDLYGTCDSFDEGLEADEDIDQESYEECDSYPNRHQKILLKSLDGTAIKSSPRQYVNNSNIAMSAVTATYKTATSLSQPTCSKQRRVTTSPQFNANELHDSLRNAGKYLTTDNVNLFEKKEVNTLSLQQDHANTTLQSTKEQMDDSSAGSSKDIIDAGSERKSTDELLSTSDVSVDYNFNYRTKHGDPLISSNRKTKYVQSFSDDSSQ